MDAATHTPGRMTWMRRPDASLIYVIRDHKAGSHAQGDIHINEANLRRLAACWNACEGLSTELLESITTVGDTLLDRFEQREKTERELKAQRDELLGALKYHQEQTRPIQRTIDAISQVEGTPTIQHVPSDDTEGGAV